MKIVATIGRFDHRGLVVGNARPTMLFSTGSSDPMSRDAIVPSRVIHDRLLSPSMATDTLVIGPEDPAQE